MPNTKARAVDHPVISSEDVEGATVFDLKGKKLGKIDHLMIEKVSGRVLSAIITARGFVGLGHSHYELPWSSLSYQPKLNGYQTNIEESELKKGSAATAR